MFFIPFTHLNLRPVKGILASSVDPDQTPQNAVYTICTKTEISTKDGNNLSRRSLYSLSRPRWLSWMRRPTGDQEVAGSTPAEVGNIH